MIKDYQPTRGIPAGYLDRKISFYGLTETTVDYAPRLTYALVKTTWANVRQLSGTEAILSEAQTNTAIVEIHLRYQKFLYTDNQLYETFVIDMSNTEPVFMRDNNGDALLDQNGNPMVSNFETLTDRYEILEIDPFESRKRSMKITAQRWR